MSFPRRIVGDYDVDRLEVEVWQHMQLTSTNHPFGLIPIFWNWKLQVTVNGLKQSRPQEIKKCTLRVDVSERAESEEKVVTPSSCSSETQF